MNLPDSNENRGKWQQPVGAARVAWGRLTGIVPRTSLFASAIALALGTSGTALAADTLVEDLTEARQETQIWTTYALSPYLRAHDLKVSVHAGRATLSGTVDGEVNRDLAQQIALGVGGIRDVDNRIEVQDDYVPPRHSSARGYGDAIDDTSVTAAVKSKLLWSKHTDGLDTHVETRSGRVTLKGTADSAESRALATRLAMDTRGVASVDNRMDIRSGTRPSVGTSSKAVQDVNRDIADSWITAKVKSTFMYSSNVSSSDIGVSTNSGIVTLTGRVRSGAERALAIELADNIRGVKGVDSANLTTL